MANSKGKKKTLLIIGVAVVLIAVIIGAIAVIEDNSYVCYDCDKAVYFEEYVIPVKEEKADSFVCEECYEDWQKNNVA